ncbi:unnamed protein product [Lactuca saligna]|uniref:Uncharacterized protein n=1 Tax=Lactuca saligna TaxID=75948 RepID=A0AA35VTW8_LACSI|nr:unnamed protein product [Lactuca saligna]
MATVCFLGRDLTTEEWESFEFRFGFVPEHGVQIPIPDASLYNPPEGKGGIPVALFEAVLHFPTTNFFNLIIHEYGFTINGEDWFDCFLATDGMSTAWRAHEKMPEFFVEKEGSVLLRLFYLAPFPPFNRQSTLKLAFW